MARIDTASVLFTDLVASTELHSRLGSDAGDEFRRLHDRLLGDTVAAYNGHVVKGLGDGLLATFGAAADAVGAAVAIQQAIDTHGRQQPEQAFSVRIGISVGDLTVEEGDVFGRPVVEAARLCDTAVGGEILVAEVVRLLARERRGLTFDSIGFLELKGLPDPVPACRVPWEPATTVDGGDGVLPVPGLLTAGAATVYVGRPDLLGRLHAAWDDASGGDVRTILLSGEPGVGKTRTAAEAARRAHASGAAVLYGRCDEELPVPYQPFVEALEWYVAHAPLPVLGHFPGELARLVPDLGTHVADLPPPVVSDPRTEEHRLFEAVASWLVDLSNEHGLVLVVDDVHWAAKPTLLLLQHVIRAANAGSRALTIATYRDTDVDRTHPLSATLGDLRRIPGVERLSVDGLTADEVAALVAAAAGHELDETAARLAATIHAETEGNPFFVGEVLRHLVETGGVKRESERWVVPDPDHVSVPEGVRDVVGRRLSQLTDEANALLSMAAVVGREVDLSTLVALGGHDEDAVLDRLDEALRARLIDEAAPERFRFSHALVRTTLYEELSATRRLRLHRRVRDVIEELNPGDVVALAHHSVEAGPIGDDLVRAVEYVLAAAEQARAARAASEAEERFLQALDLVEDLEEPQPRLEIQALCGLGECQRDLGEPRYRETLLDAGRRAELEGATDLLVRAVLSNYRGTVAFVGEVDEARVHLTQRALGAVGPVATADRIRLLAHLANEVTFASESGQRLALCDEAEALSRAQEDPGLLGWVLGRTSLAAVTSDRTERLLERNREGWELAQSSGDPALQMTVGFYHHGALLTAGRVTESRRLVDEMIDLAETVGTPTMRWMAQSPRIKFLAAAGRFEEAEEAVGELLRVGEELGEPDAQVWWGGALAPISFMKGSVGTLADFFGPFADAYPGVATWRAAQAWAMSEGGRLDEARRIIDEYGFVPEEMLQDCWPHLVESQLGLTAYHLRDAALGRQVVAVLERCPGEWVHWFIGTIGPTALAMGMASAACGDWERGERLVEEALSAADEAELPGLANTCRSYLARLLLDHDNPGDRGRARAVLDTLGEEALRMGADGLVEQAETLATR